MQEFNILGNVVSFEDDLPKCANIYLQKSNCIDKYTALYNNEKSSSVNSINELITYMEKMLNIINKSMDDSSNSILNILVENQILDKSEKDIKSGCQDALKKCNQYIRSVMNEIEKANRISENTLNDIKRQSARIADNSVDGNYLHVWSNSVWSLTVADYMNLKEEQKVERQKEKIYNKNVNAAYGELQQLEREFAIEKQKTLQVDLYKYGLLAIEDLFIYCMNILIAENKISNSITNNLEKAKSLTILQNVERLQDKTIIQEQLIIALKSYPFSKEVHLKILDYITNDIEEYIKLVKFLKCENIVVEICLNNSSIKYLEILKNLGGNSYLQKYLDNFEFDTNDIQKIQKAFETLKNVWNEDNSIIVQKEKSVLLNILKNIEHKYNVTYNGNFEDLNYKVLNDFIDIAKQNYIVSNHKKQKRRKKLSITFWVIFAIWNLLLFITQAPQDVFLVTDIFILLIYMIVHNILKAIRMYKEQRK